MKEWNTSTKVLQKHTAGLWFHMHSTYYYTLPWVLVAPPTGAGANILVTDLTIKCKTEKHHWRQGEGIGQNLLLYCVLHLTKFIHLTKPSLACSPSDFIQLSLLPAHWSLQQTFTNITWGCFQQCSAYGRDTLLELGDKGSVPLWEREGWVSSYLGMFLSY